MNRIPITDNQSDKIFAAGAKVNPKNNPKTNRGGYRL